MKYLKKLFGFFGQESESKQEVTSASEVVNEVSEVEATKPQEKSSTSVEDSKVDVSVSDSLSDKENGDAKTVKSKIYNMLIVDESGSMSGLTQVTLSGVNEIISTIKEAQKKHGEVQQHFITLVTFDERNDNKVLPIRTIWNALPISQVNEFKDYRPQGCTPLYDAVGDSLRNLHEKIKKDEDATGAVTILTDGLENASRRWSAYEVKRLIEQLKKRAGHSLIWALLIM